MSEKSRGNSKIVKVSMKRQNNIDTIMKKSRALTKKGSKQNRDVLVQSNRFGLLSEPEEQDQAESSLKNKSSNKPQPLILTDPKFRINQNLKQLFIQSKISGGYCLKFMSIGTKVLFNKQEDFNILSSFMTENNLEFFTHRSKTERIFKAVLSGLPNLPIEEIKLDLKERYNLEVNAVTNMTEHNLNNNRALFLLEFKKDNINLKMLNNIKQICCCMVTWRPYSPKYKGPTQCRRCAWYGHGQSHCKRPPICILCASRTHSIDCCPFKDRMNDLVAFKCCNCTVNKKRSDHRADDPNCPSRIEYLSIRQKITLRNQNREKTVPNINQRSFELDSLQFPHPTKSSCTQNPVILQRPQSRATEQPQTFAECLKSSDQQNDMFSIDEMFNIFTTHLDMIQNCKSKNDQIRVIASLLQHAINK